MSSHPPKLEYAPGGIPWYRSGKTRRTVWGCFVLVAAGFLIPWAYHTFLVVRLNYYMRQCLSYEPAAGQVVFEDATATKFLIAPEWKKLYNAWSPSPLISSGTLFLHERFTPDGKRRLVTVDVVDVDSSISIYSRVFDPGSMSGPRLVGDNLEEIRRPGVAFTIFAGQPDPKDARHFTIEYRSGDWPGIIDGWLRANDTVSLEPRENFNAPAPATSPVRRSPASSP